MADTLTLAYCLQFDGEHFTVGDLIKITTTSTILIGRLDKITTNSIVLDCSEEYNSKMVSVPIGQITKVSADLTITSTPMTPIIPIVPSVPDNPTDTGSGTDNGSVDGSGSTPDGSDNIDSSGSSPDGSDSADGGTTGTP